MNQNMDQSSNLKLMSVHLFFPSCCILNLKQHQRKCISCHSTLFPHSLSLNPYHSQTFLLHVSEDLHFQPLGGKGSDFIPAMMEARSMVASECQFSPWMKGLWSCSSWFHYFCYMLCFVFFLLLLLF